MDGNILSTNESLINDDSMSMGNDVSSTGT